MNSDIIIFSCGTQFSSLIPTYKTKGFNLIAVDSSGTNAFFVKKEFASYFEILSPVKSWRSVDRVITPILGLATSLIIGVKSFCKNSFMID